MDDLHELIESGFSKDKQRYKKTIGFSQILNNLAKANQRLCFKLPPAKARDN
jgi:hypothetical protein